MISKEEKLNFLKNINKEVDLHLILEEILPELGFSDVVVTHEKGNRPEFGKDLICSRYDNLEDKKDWYAFVVKKGKLSGSSGSIREVDDQVYECFKHAYKSVEHKRNIPINKVKVVTNENISSGAKDKILARNNEDRANIDFWDANKLISLIDVNFQTFWLKGSKQYKKYVEIFKERIQVDNLTKALGIEDKKAKKIFENLIQPKLNERIKSADGKVKWVSKQISTIINLESNSFIIGEAGSGKTTLFKELANEIIDQNSFRNEVEFYPILLSFRELKDANFDLKIAIKDYFRKDWNINLVINFEKVIEQEKCCIFIDALDELAIDEDKERAIDAVNLFKKKYDKIKVICSSRHSDFLFYNCEDAGFKYLEINSLNRVQIESFINSYFSEDDIKSKRLLKSLKDSGILDKLPKNPLTIALVTILFDENEVEIPATITDLYGNFVDLLLGKYKPESTIDILEIGAKHRLLCFIAKELHSSNVKTIKSVDLETLIKGYADERGHKIDYNNIIDDIITNTGLLVSNSRNEIQFKHLSFQEYFTAYEIFHHRQKDRSILIQNFNNLWWQNVCIFYAGLSKDAPDLITDIIENNKPISLRENILNIGGMGKLLQALYNTPISERKLGLKHSTESLSNILRLADSNSGSSEITYWRGFSRFGLMQVFTNFFAANHWSITLVEPMEQLFDEIYNSGDDNSYIELELYIMAAILGSNDFQNFSRLKQFSNKENIDVNLLALMDDNLRKLKKDHKDIFKSNATFRSVSTKVQRKINTIPNIEDLVNSSIGKNKEELPTQSLPKGTTEV